MRTVIIVTTIFIFSLLSADAVACRSSMVLRSKRLISAVLDDVIKTYKAQGGGGISGIKLIATDVYKVSILQEKRIDETTYHLTTLRNCGVKILKKTKSTRSPGPKKRK
jgi:hypothetical protein